MAHMTKAPPLPPRIKVFRAQIGFGDWVVATSSKTLALEAWDVSRDLFATGEAEQTDDPKAIAAAMTNIGKAVAMPRPKRKR
jgi:colicin import membrane protein